MLIAEDKYVMARWDFVEFVGQVDKDAELFVLDFVDHEVFRESRSRKRK